MKFIHISDTHLGFNAYRKTDPKTGLNQREVDTSNVFKRAIDEIIKIKPDFVLHTGDLFDSFRPANHIVTFALRELLRLAKYTKIIILSGNHSTPRTINYGSVFELFNFFPELNVFYKSKYETIKINNTVIHIVPHCPDNKHFHSELSKLQLYKDCYNILAVHCAVEGNRYSMDDFGEIYLPQKYLDTDFNYIALGHYHSMSKLNQRAYYCGSTERFSLNEAKDNKGFIVIDLKTNQTNFIKLPIRQMVNLSIDCSNLTPEILNKKINSFLDKTSVAGKIIKLELDNLDKNTYQSIDNEIIKDATSKSVHFKLNANIADEVGNPSLNQEIGNINQEFGKFTKDKNISNLCDLGLFYLNKASES